MHLPPRLQATGSTSAVGRDWLARLPEVCERLSAQWKIQLGEPYPECNISWVAPAEGTSVPAVLKVPMPAKVQVRTLAGDFRGHEAVALRAWGGSGATLLLEHDEGTGAMLVERCVPGDTLDSVPDVEAADEIVAHLLAQLHLPACDGGGIPKLGERAQQLADELPGRFEQAGRPFDEWLVREAAESLVELASCDGPPVLLHGDTHHHNILASERESWLAIDPLPMVGDPAYDSVQYLLFRKGDLRDPETEWGTTISRFCRLADVDEERVKAWTFARLVSDALAACEAGRKVEYLEARQDSLWTARLLHRL